MKQGDASRDTGAAEAAVRHTVLGTSLRPPYPRECAQAVFGLGCFWGAERLFWSLPGVFVTAVGYAGGRATQVSYRAVCTGTTGHAEVVKVVFRPAELSFKTLLQHFWQAHDPTQGMRQGPDVGSQYRSAIYCCDAAQLALAQASRDLYQQALLASGVTARITTEIALAETFYFAESEHQQYLAKHPDGYCGLGGTGVACPVIRGPDD